MLFMKTLFLVFLKSGSNDNMKKYVPFQLAGGDRYLSNISFSKGRSSWSPDLFISRSLQKKTKTNELIDMDEKLTD